MLAALRRPNRPRRGVTLVEMLVVVALVVLMMVILVQIFQAATGAMLAARTTQELDVVLRSVDSMLRADLAGVTAQMTPPNDPSRKTGYFEYGENAFADAQGEDTDDYLAFTTKAPEGQVFNGRQYLSGLSGLNATINNTIQPITISSQVAEVIYFLRNGNLYRRVFLVAPSRVNSIATGTLGGGGFPTSIFGISPTGASWQGMNDISCRPNVINASGQGILQPLPNDLGDLTNRENRAFRPRFFNDINPLDGFADDNNADGIPDYYPTLYYDGVGHANGSVDWLPNASMNSYAAVGLFPVPFPNGLTRTQTNPYDAYAFPFIYPGMYSVPDFSTVSSGNVTPAASTPQVQLPSSVTVGMLGWHHGMMPGQENINGITLTLINHAPLDGGDFLPAPVSPFQSWFGFPTWRETMTVYNGTVGWGDPVVRVNYGGNSKQPLGLSPFPPGVKYSINDTRFPLPLTQTGTTAPPPFTDGAGSQSFYPNPGGPLNHVWEDDLILTNVRSFDVKAYDPDAPLYSASTAGPFGSGYQDLGYGSPTIIANPTNKTSYLGGWTPNSGGQGPPFQPSTSSEPTGFGHEGRIPPIPNDFRHDPRNGNLIGDSQVGVIRLTRVFDTWSTDYTNAPSFDVFLNGYGSASPVYPAFPAPYPSALRGIQVQIRVVDPRNERSKVLTIRHDFTDKLTN